MDRSARRLAATEFVELSCSHGTGDDRRPSHDGLRRLAVAVTLVIFGSAEATRPYIPTTLAVGDRAKHIDGSGGYALGWTEPAAPAGGSGHHVHRPRRSAGSTRVRAADRPCERFDRDHLAAEHSTVVIEASPGPPGDPATCVGVP